MDRIIKQTPRLSGELKALVEKAEKTYHANFNGDAWFGRCIFLSWYCEKGTCDFCFRSTQKHKIKHPKTARRSVASVLSEAALISGLGWHLEFLTGGYGIYTFKELLKIVEKTHAVLGKKLWINLGAIEKMEELVALQPHVEGIVSSLETLNPILHDKVCPDKPIEPYLEMIAKARKLGFKQSFTLVIGLGEKQEDFGFVKKLIDDYQFERVTIYALRPVAGTPYTTGPTPQEVAWWIAKIRTEFPTIEIIAGTAIYRIPEISLFLRAGANAFTKLPATKMFNTKDAQAVVAEVKKAKRNFTSQFTAEDMQTVAPWDELVKASKLRGAHKKEFEETLATYLKGMQKNAEK